MKRNLLAGAALLAVPALSVNAGEWSGQITPYVWAAGVGGDITPFSGAPSLSFDKSASEILEDLDGAFFLSGYARRDRLVLMGDLSWSSSSKSGAIPPGLPAEAKLKQRSLTLLAGWRAVTNDDMSLDLLAGLRAWKIEGSVNVAGGMLSASPSKNFGSKPAPSASTMRPTLVASFTEAWIETRPISAPAIWPGGRLLHGGVD